MKLFLKLFLFVCVSSGSAFAQNISSFFKLKPGAQPRIIFQDEFDYFNGNNWKHEINMNGGGNNEFQIYDRHDTNTYVRDGILYVRPTLTSDRYGEDFLSNGYLRLDGCTDDFGCAGCCERQGNPEHIIPPIISSRLRTKASFSMKYGIVEIRAKLPAGDWTWPAIWMLPEDSVYGGWPASGEIDIMESRGNRNLMLNGVNIGSEQVGSTLHYGPHWPHNGYWAAHAVRNSAPGNGYDRDFHVYQLEWTPEHLRFGIDGMELTTIRPPPGGFFELGQFPGDVHNPWVPPVAENPRMAPFDKNFHFLLNVAVGGHFFPDAAQGPYPKPWNGNSQTQLRDFWQGRHNWLPTWQGEDAAMQVDYVRAWAL